MLKVNEGTLDRVLRVLLGVTLVTLAVTKGWMWAYIGIVPILTGATGMCPLYSMLGINTCGIKKG